MNSNTLVKLLASLCVLIGVGVSSVMSYGLAASVGQNKLSYTDRVEDGDPPQVALGIAMGAFRGLFVNVLWIRANELKEQGKYHEAIELSNAITRLQPRFPRVWVFHAWNMAYNISVVTQTPEERWQWVQAGVRLLRDQGIPYNPNEMLLYKELAWLYIHKIGGYTDDASQFYKRKVAQEWTEIMGRPPAIRLAESRSREDVIDLFANWVKVVVDAPETREGVISAVPAAADLLRELEARIGFENAQEILKRYTFHQELSQSPLRGVFERDWGPKNQAFAELLGNSKYADAWPVLIAHLRKRVLIDEYSMSPHTMERLTRQWGPIDWRHPMAHALYWSALGIERGEERVSEENQTAFDFVNTNRMIMQALAELWRGGEMYFNYIEFSRGGDGSYLAMPNVYFSESYGDLYAQVVKLGGIFEDRERRAMTPYATGYENFLQDVISMYYRRGQYAEAEKWYERLRTFEGQNINDPDRDIEFSRPLDEFVRRNLWDRYESPNVARQDTFASLQQAYAALLIGDVERFDASFKYAQDAHAHYLRAQFRPMVANGTNPRMEYIPQDFRHYAGMVYAMFFSNLALAEAEQAYLNAPDDLKQYAYDTLSGLYRDAINALAERGESKTFDAMFPEPPGMENFRRAVQEREEQERVWRERLNVEQK